MVNTAQDSTNAPNAPVTTNMLLSRDEAARFCGVSARTLDRLIRRGELSSTRVGHQIRIPFSALQRYLSERSR